MEVQPGCSEILSRVVACLLVVIDKLAMALNSTRQAFSGFCRSGLWDNSSEVDHNTVEDVRVPIR